MISIKILNGQGDTVRVAHGENEVIMPVNYTYCEGDRIHFGFDRTNCFVVLQADDALGSELVYVTGDVDFRIPFGAQKICYSPKIFSGDKHLLSARFAEKEEVAAYRNLARNVMDQHENDHGFPHAAANVETRGEAVFAARNAIDGVKANLSHGEWPYGSWGINQNPEAVIKVDFGRNVVIDKLKIYLRADFPHDNWWKEITVRFSDETVMVCPLKKTSEGQCIELEPKTVSWIQLEHLIRSEEASPFPALTQLEAYGNEVAK